MGGGTPNTAKPSPPARLSQELPTPYSLATPYSLLSGHSPLPTPYSLATPYSGLEFFSGLGGYFSGLQGTQLPFYNIVSSQKETFCHQGMTQSLQQENYHSWEGLSYSLAELSPSQAARSYSLMKYIEPQRVIALATAFSVKASKGLYPLEAAFCPAREQGAGSFEQGAGGSEQGALVSIL